ncbi:hypothetical protein [Bacillus sp. ISL-7]|uniref:hypothetical protein n=1 Tax=Bacillus sp. ISL-7 TaxID=2819136 RepID=UPI001BE5C790|nr:hypothetical protein [Bacillus sp. ISL-7]MBT2734746.1 hypothetical protein [Bacillus sp. ISL-7]
MSEPHNYQLKLRTGDEVIFTADITADEVQSLPRFANQAEFFKFFTERTRHSELPFVIIKIIKPPLVKEDDDESWGHCCSNRINE